MLNYFPSASYTAILLTIQVSFWPNIIIFSGNFLPPILVHFKLVLN
uniref:Uncharacterized protein n=1 Tax=Rhizophora mucronata TaxID=61149 RepID=A0A2P2P1S5_RHIMU